ncbi:alpha/beta hydrolase [Sphingobacterium sp.]|uniref:alpha/beta fold hydrolase n=1 Tax=Sphingobacterium sp. TaxID=341027 RepID=UPI0031CF5E71
MKIQLNTMTKMLTFSIIMMLGAGISKLNAQTSVNEKKSETEETINFHQTKTIQAGLLNVGYAEIGPNNGKPVILLHGWPYDIHSFEQSAAILAKKGYRVLVPYLRGYGTTTFLSPQTMRNGQQSAVALDIIKFMDALKIEKAIIGGFDWGARTADIIAALWPERCWALVAVSGYLIGSPKANENPLPPNAEFLWWYQYYFATERGYKGYKANTQEFNKLIWKTASPKWNFNDQTYKRSSKSFDNPDHADIVIHNYRWRLGLAKGEKQYDELEDKLAKAPDIIVPTVTLEGDANGAAFPPPASYASKYKGKYKHHTLNGGVGHNLPQEAPEAFTEAIIEADLMAQ